PQLPGGRHQAQSPPVIRTFVRPNESDGSGSGNAILPPPPPPGIVNGPGAASLVVTIERAGRAPTSYTLVRPACAAISSLLVMTHAGRFSSRSTSSRSLLTETRRRALANHDRSASGPIASVTTNPGNTRERNVRSASLFNRSSVTATGRPLRTASPSGASDGQLPPHACGYLRAASPTPGSCCPSVRMKTN